MQPMHRNHKVVQELAACILEILDLKKKMQAGTVFPSHLLHIGGVEMPIVILGELAYLLLPGS